MRECISTRSCRRQARSRAAGGEADRVAHGAASANADGCGADAMALHPLRRRVGEQERRCHRWNGLAVYGVDGTTLRVPDSDENRSFLGGQSAGANGRGESGYPMVRLAALMVLRSHLIAAAAFGPYADERVYAQELWAALPDDSVTIVDRLYFGAATLYPIARDGTNRHWLTRKRAKTSYTVVEKLGRDDEIVELEIQAKARAG